MAPVASPIESDNSILNNFEINTIKTPPTAVVIKEIAKKEIPFFLMFAIKVGPAINPIGARKSTSPNFAKNFGTSKPKCPKKRATIKIAEAPNFIPKKLICPKA